MSSVDLDFDTAKGEAFAERMMGLLNDGFLGFLVSIGHRAGLFDTLAEVGPAQSTAVAASAGLARISHTVSGISGSCRPIS